MTSNDHRSIVRQLADDLAWLETHCQANPDLSAHSGHLRLAAGMARSVVGPALDGQAPVPLFIAVVGGAGTGKSTVTNILLGSAEAESNPQAGYTRHPTAYLSAEADATWPAYAGFLGPLRRLTEPAPGNLDEDVYQVRRTKTAGALSEFAVWDCPDMTTWAAGGYISRLFEVAALADVIVYVASDERYNDAVPTEFLRALIKAGKPVVVVLTKMRDADATTLVDHFRKDVLGRLPTPPTEIPIVAIPAFTPEERNDVAKAALRFRAELVNPILALSATPELARQRTVANAVKYLEMAAAGLVDVAKQDLDQVEAWKTMVRAGRGVFEERYQKEFLAGEAFRAFDATQARILDAMELSGSGKPVSRGLAFARLPVQFARKGISKLIVRPPGLNLPEQTVLNNGLSAWLDSLQAEAIRRAGTHPLWKQLAAGFGGAFKTEGMDKFAVAYRAYEAKETQEVNAASKAVEAKFTEQPMVLNGLRVGTISLQVVAVVLAIVFTWPPSWWLLLLIPLVIALAHGVVEFSVFAFINRARGQVRDHRMALVGENLSAPIENWLTEIPAKGGTPLERLRQVVTRVPELTKALTAVFARTQTTPAKDRPE